MAGKKKIFTIVGIIIVIIILILVITPIFVNADRFRPQIEAALSQNLGRKVEIGHLSASLFSGSLKADHITIADDPAFSREPFVTANSLAVGVDMTPLIFSHQLHVRSIEIKRPQVQLLRTAAGKWNFATLGATEEPAKAEPGKGQLQAQAAPLQKQPSSPPDSTQSSSASNSTAPAGLNGINVGKLKITDGTVAFGRAGQGSLLAYKDVNVSASDISQNSRFPFQFDADTPSGGKLNLTGSMGPLGSGDAEKMPFSGQMKAENVPAEDIEALLAVLGYALPTGSKLRGGTINANLSLRGPLEGLVTQGPVQLSNVTLAGFSLASKLAAVLGQGGASSSNDTLIKIASSNIRYAPEGVRAEDLNIEIPAIGSVTGDGTVGSDNALNFNLLAKLAGSSPLAQLTKLPFFNKDGGLPFRVEGTTSSPLIIPNVAGISNLAGLAKTPLNKLKVPNKGALGSIIGGLLQKKKKPQSQPPQ